MSQSDLFWWFGTNYAYRYNCHFCISFTFTFTSLFFFFFLNAKGHQHTALFVVVLCVRRFFFFVNDMYIDTGFVNCDLTYLPR